MVQEYGMSAFRFAAIASLAIKRLSSCQLLTSTQVTNISRQNNESNWQVTMKTIKGETIKQSFDYVINACGFKSGEIDDMVQAKRQRMVEFKAAYVAHWPQCQGLWPEVVIYGQRGTPQGMAQLTPYPNGFFQLHGMTQDITLFDEGLVASCQNSAQPKLAQRFINKIEQEWPKQIVNNRTLGSIEHIFSIFTCFYHSQSSSKTIVWCSANSRW